MFNPRSAADVIAAVRSLQELVAKLQARVQALESAGTITLPDGTRFDNTWPAPESKPDEEKEHRASFKGKRWRDTTGQGRQQIDIILPWVPTTEAQACSSAEIGAACGLGAMRTGKTLSARFTQYGILRKKKPSAGVEGFTWLYWKP